MSNMAKLILMVALGAALLSAGCGGSDSSAESGRNGITVEAGSLSKAQFIKQADAICQKRVQEAHEAFEAFLKRHPLNLGSGSPRQLRLMVNAVTTVIAPPLETQIAEVEDLGAPAGDEVKVSSILEATQAALRKGKTNPAVLIGGGAFAESSALARRYGLAVCGDV